MPPLGYDGSVTLVRVAGAPGDGASEVVDVIGVVADGIRRAAADTSGDLGIVVDDAAGPLDAPTTESLVLAVAVAAPGDDVLHLVHEDFGRQVEALDAQIVEVALRWHPDDPADVKKVQAQELVRLGAWLHETRRRLLVDLRVARSGAHAARDGAGAGDDVAELTRRVVVELHDLGIEPDLWALPSIGDAEAAASLAALVADEGRDAVGLLLAADGDDPAGEAPSEAAAYRGSVVGRDVWEAAVAAHRAGTATREEAIARIAEAIIGAAAPFNDVRG